MHGGAGLEDIKRQFDNNLITRAFNWHRRRLVQVRLWPSIHFKAGPEAAFLGGLLPVN